MTKLKFGTDGWRAIIGEDFIPENVEKVIQAFCDWRQEFDPAHKEVIIGYDRRLHARASARLACAVLLGNNFSVLLSEQYCPTPCISWMVKESPAFAGIMITASHNPHEWSGIKFKESYGGSASPEYTQAIEAQVDKNDASGRVIQKSAAMIKTFDPKKEYLGQLRSLLDMRAIEKSPYRVLYDSLYGSGGGFVQALLGDKVDEIHGDADPTFGGINPEPISQNLGELLERMKSGDYGIGIATDGDADRIGAVDEHGRFVNSHQIFALLLKHYVEDHGLGGVVVKSVSTTNMIQILCQRYGLPLIETPIGFKHICKEMVAHNALMGGEESGGISFQKHVHERDGILNGLMLINMMCLRRKSLSELVQDLSSEIGLFCFDRWDRHLEPAIVTAIREKMGQLPVTCLAGLPVVETNFIDGYKYILADQSWLLIRASGTEPLVRLYAEASSEAQVKKILQAGESLIQSLT